MPANDDSKDDPEAGIASPSEVVPTGHISRVQVAMGGMLMLLLTQGWSWALSLIEVTFIPRWLGATNYGKLSLAGSVLSVASVLVSFGGASQIIRTVAAVEGTHTRFITSVLVFRSLVGVPIIVGLCLLMYLWAEPVVFFLSVLAGINMYLAWVLEALFAYRQAQAQFRTYARAEISAQTVSVLSKLALVSHGLGVAGAAYGEMLRTVTGILSVWFSRSGNLRLARIGREDLVRLVKGGAPYFMHNVCSWLYATPTTSYMLVAWAGYDANGWFAVSQRFLGLLFVLPSVVVSVLMPLLTRAYERSPEQFSDLSRRVVSPMMVMSIPFGLLFLLRGEAIIYALGLGRGYANVPILLQISGAGLLLRWASMYYGLLLIASNRVRRQAKAALYAAPFNLALTAILVIATQRGWRNGAIGAVLAAELTEVLIVFIYIRALDDSALLRANLRALGRGLLAGIVPAFLLYYLPMPNRLAFLGITALSIIAFFPVAVWVGAIRKDEVAPILNLLRNRMQRGSAPLPPA